MDYLGYFSSANTHSKSNISLSEGRTVVGSITSYSYYFSQFSETFDQDELIFWGTTGNNLECGNELVQLVLIFGDFTESIDGILYKIEEELGGCYDIR